LIDDDMECAKEIDSSDINFEELIKDTDLGSSCQETYEGRPASISFNDEEQLSYNNKISECIGIAIIDTQNATACAAWQSRGMIEHCYVTTAVEYLYSYCPCTYITEDEVKEDCNKDTPAILEKITIEDLPKYMQQQPEPIDYELFSETEYVPTPSGQKIYGDEILWHGYHFAKLDTSECLKLVEYTEEQADEIVYDYKNYDTYFDCIVTLGNITANEKVCDVLVTEPDPEYPEESEYGRG